MLLLKYTDNYCSEFFVMGDDIDGLLEDLEIVSGEENINLKDCEFFKIEPFIVTKTVSSKG